MMTTAFAYILHLLFEAPTLNLIRLFYKNNQSDCCILDNNTRKNKFNLPGSDQHYTTMVIVSTTNVSNTNNNVEKSMINQEIANTINLND